MKSRHHTSSGKYLALAIIVAICIYTYRKWHTVAPSHDISTLRSHKDQIIPLAIIGSGPAGLSAALYGARSAIHTVVFEGKQPGGQLTTTSYVENWPGIEKKLGKDIMNGLRNQATSFGAHFSTEEITDIDVSQWPFKLTTESGLKLEALSLVIASGAKPKILNVPGEKEYWGRGVTTCALCDGPFYKDGEVVVVGGGDSALEEATQLAPYAKKITILVRSDKLRAAASMQERLADYSHIEIRYNTKIAAIKGDENHVHSIDIITGETSENMKIDGVFLAIGHEPNTKLIRQQIACDQNGYILLDKKTQETSVAGAFSAGDVSDHRYRQAGVASGDGIKAALDAIEYLRSAGINDRLLEELRPRFYQPEKGGKTQTISSLHSIEEYEQLITSTDKPLLLDFYTEFCPTCLQMMPVVSRVAEEFKEKMSFFKVDALALNQLAEMLVVPTVPTLLVIKDKNVVARSQNVMSAQELKEFIAPYIDA